MPVPAPMPRRAVVAMALAVASVLATAGCSTGRDAPAAAYASGERPAAPQLAGELLGGGRYDLGNHRGEVVVVNFWASWCPPCRDEVPELVAVREATRDEGVSFLGINVRDDRDRATAFLAAHPTGYPSLFDPAGESALRFQVPPNTIPATLIVDRHGRLAAVFRKALLRDELQPAVERIAAER